MYKAISGDAMREVLEEFPASFRIDMNVLLTKAITEKELSTAFMSMAKGSTGA